MPFSAGPIARYRSYWLPETIVLALLALATIIVFSTTDLDIVSARWFYHPDQKNPWPVASQPLWAFFYGSAPWVTGSLALAGTLSLVLGLLRKEAREFRIHGLFILLCVALGPGLIVNGILKDHWGRARPRQVTEFGGRHAYTQPLALSEAHGKSFPCGHCSVGYLYGAGWWLWRRKYPKLAALSLAAGLALGALLGFGRLAAGGHFLSDNIWSGLIALGGAHVLYYFVLRVPAREDFVPTVYPFIEKDRRCRIAAIAGTVLLGAGIVTGGIVASPHYRDLTHRIYLDNYAKRPQVIEISAERVDVEIVLTDEPGGEVRCSGAVHGFGLPTNTISAQWEYRDKPESALQLRLSPRGWFPDIDGVLRVELPRKGIRRVAVRVKKGTITVDQSRLAERGDLPMLDLAARDGRVLP